MTHILQNITERTSRGDVLLFIPFTWIFEIQIDAGPSQTGRVSATFPVRRGGRSARGGVTFWKRGIRYRELLLFVRAAALLFWTGVWCYREFHTRFYPEFQALKQWLCSIIFYFWFFGELCFAETVTVFSRRFLSLSINISFDWIFFLDQRDLTCSQRWNI